MGHAGFKSEPVDQATALDLLFSHKAEFTRAFLEQHDLASSGTKPQLRGRLEEALATKKVRIESIIERIDEIEGWGDQHVYLFAAPAGLLSTWRSEESVRRLLRSGKALSLLNAHSPLTLPTTPTLSRISWSEERVRFVWITTRNWEERLEKEDKRVGLKVWKAYEQRTARGVLSFDWDLLSGNAMLMIERLPTGNDYQKAKIDLAERLKPFLDLSMFDSIEVGRAIKKIEKSHEAMNRALALRSQRGTKVTFTSGSRKRDAFEGDRDAIRSRDSLGDNVSGDTGNFYWKQAGPLTDELHSTIYSNDRRIGIFWQKSEEEVTYVIGRIRQYCQTLG